LLGYSSGFLLTRGSYALGDARTPTTVYATACAVGVVAMFVVGGGLDGRARLVALGLVHAAVVTVAAVALLAHLRRRLHRPVPVAGGLARAAASAVAAGAAAWAVVAALDAGSRAEAAAVCALAGAAAVAAFLAVAIPTASAEVNG
jgi:putative peptidoglycan lipid II flippase